MNIVEIGRNIAAARKKAGLTQEELAQQTGITAQAVSKWENGQKSSIMSGSGAAGRPAS